MQEELLKKFKDFKEKGTVLKGTVKLVQHSTKYNDDILLLESNGTQAVIKREDCGLKEEKSLVRYVGTVVKFVIKEIEEDGTLICSRKAVKESERDALIQKLEAGKEVDGKIVHIEKYGAYLDIDGATAIIRNIDFSNDHTRVADLHKIGDVIRVKLNRVTSTKKILVEAVEKYCEPTSVDFSTFSPQQVVVGTIRTIKTFGCYVCIAPNLDALASVPEFPDIQVEEGMKVILKISKVNAEEGRVRGKIIRVITDESELAID